MSRHGRSARGPAAIIASLSLLAAVPAAPASAISPTACVVTNLDSDNVQYDVAGAIALADPGTHLAVRGVCTGDITVNRDLYFVGIRPDGAVAPAIVGDGTGSVVTVTAGKSVRFVGLTITGGGNVEQGGGIFVSAGAVLGLRDVTVRGNRAGSGGGIYADAATVWLRGTTTIRNNIAEGGGGVSMNGLTLVLEGSASIRNNRANGYGGGILVANASVELHDSASIHHNTADGSGRYGGAGAFLDFSSTMLMADASSVHHNSTPAAGGGILVTKSALVMQNTASVHHNTSGVQRSGAIEILTSGAAGASLVLADSASIRQNTSGARGGGVVSWQACGDNPPILIGVSERTTGNTPKQVVLASGCGYV